MQEWAAAYLMRSRPSPGPSVYGCLGCDSNAIVSCAPQQNYGAKPCQSAVDKLQYTSEKEKFELQLPRLHQVLSPLQIDIKAASWDHTAMEVP